MVRAISRNRWCLARDWFFGLSYADVAAAAAVGTIGLFSWVFNRLNPIEGLLVDRTRSRHSEARMWLLDGRAVRALGIDLRQSRGLCIILPRVRVLA